MKRIAWMIVAAAVLVVAPIAAETRSATTKLEGTWSWSSGRDGTMEAIFTPTGDAAWDVDFHFEFRGTPHTYSGTAEGSLEEGRLSGTVKTEDGSRSFTFEGTFADGKLRGSHSELRSGGERSTGTLTLTNPSVD